MKNSITNLVSHALGVASDRDAQLGSGCWSFSVANGAAAEATARVDGNWLLLNASPSKNGRRRGPARVSRPWELLESNAGLPGLAKYALDADGRHCIRAELPVDNGFDRDGIAETCEAMKTAFQRSWCNKKAKARSNGGTPISSSDVDEPTVDLQRLLGEADWRFLERGGGRLAVDLDVPGAFHQAIVDPRAGGIHIAVELAATVSAVPACRQALGLLLLGANALVRMARAVARPGNGDGEPALQIEVVLTSRPTAAEFGHALAALSVACRLCGQEVKVLQDESIARSFLAARGWSS